MLALLGADCPLNDRLSDTRRTHLRPKKEVSRGEGGSTMSALASLSEERHRQTMDRFAALRPHLEEGVSLSRAAHHARIRPTGLPGCANSPPHTSRRPVFGFSS